MASRSVSEALFRPNPLTRIPFSRTTPPIRLLAPSRTPCRTLTNSPTSHAAQPRRKEAPVDQAPKEPDRVSTAIDDLLFSANHAPYRSAAPARRTSADELQTARAADRVFGANWSRPGAGGLRPRGIDISRLDGIPDDGLPEDALSEAPAGPPPFKEDQVYPRLNPTYGRTIELNPERGRDLVRGIGMLGSLMARNQVKRDFNQQRFHERPGLKRKRLKSQRWRARFKKGFQDVTSRVSELTRKGW